MRNQKAIRAISPLLYPLKSKCSLKNSEVWAQNSEHADFWGEKNQRMSNLGGFGDCSFRRWVFHASLPHPHQMPLIYSFIYQFFINTNYVLETVPGGGGGVWPEKQKRGKNILVLSLRWDRCIQYIKQIIKVYNAINTMEKNRLLEMRSAGWWVAVVILNKMVKIGFIENVAHKKRFQEQGTILNIL